MTAGSRGAERARHEATDLDRAGLSSPFQLVLPERTRCALHLIRDPGTLFDGIPMPGTVAALEMARKAVGVPAAAQSAWLDPGRQMRPSPVHGVRWTQFPVVGEPRYGINGPVDLLAFGRGGARPSRDGLANVVARTDTVIVHLPPGWDAPTGADREPGLAWTYHASALVGAAAWASGEDTRVWLVAPDGRVAGGIAEIRALAAGIAPWMRFRYSYALNFRAMALWLLDKALSAPDPEAYRVFRKAYPDTSFDPVTINAQLKGLLPHAAGDSPTGRYLDSPVALQVLYAIRRRGGVRPRMPVGNAMGRPWTFDLADPGGDGLSWRGSGRHAPAPLVAAEVQTAVRALANYQLLRYADDGETVVPSRTGEAFLDLLPPACEDVDLLCRWARHPLGGPDRAAMDAWIARTFGKLKRKVNAVGMSWDVPPSQED